MGISPTPMFSVQHQDADYPWVQQPHSLQGRPSSAPASRSRCRPPSGGLGRRAEQPYNPPLGAPRCSGGSPWWHTTAWSTFAPDVEVPLDSPVPFEWSAFVSSPKPPLGIQTPGQERQLWTPSAAACGKRLTPKSSKLNPRPAGL